MNKGDFLKIEYTGKIVSTGEVFDTTSEAVAKESNVYNPRYPYKPVLVVLGEGMVVPGVEKQLFDMKTGEERSFSLTPEEAFGKRDTALIRIISRTHFIKEKVAPVPGLMVDINHQKARIQSVSGGRIRVDFNHPLAGKELSYQLKITTVITDLHEKVQAVVDYYGLKAQTHVSDAIVSLTTEAPLNEVVQKLLTETMKKWTPEIKETKFLTKAMAKKP